MNLVLLVIIIGKKCNMLENVIALLVNTCNALPLWIIYGCCVSVGEQQNEDSSNIVDHHGLLESVLQNLQLNSHLESTVAK